MGRSGGRGVEVGLNDTVEKRRDRIELSIFTCFRPIVNIGTYILYRKRIKKGLHLSCWSPITNQS